MIAAAKPQLSPPVVLHTRVVTGTGGGPEKTILNSPRYLKEYGIESACAFMHPPADPGFQVLTDKARECHAEIIGLEDRGPFDWKVVRQFIRICRERNVSIWHAHDYKSNAIGLLVRGFHRMHLVTTTHGWVKFTSRAPLYYWIDKKCFLPRYSRVISVSADLEEQCRALGVKDDRRILIDNAIVVDDYRTSAPSSADRRRFGLRDGRFLFGAVGRLSSEKGFHHLVSAVAALRARGHDVGLLIAGEGDAEESLRNQIGDLGLKDAVRLVGFLSDPRELYRAIDVFVLSSLREGLPNVVLEAMASGRPVIATRINGVPRLIAHEQNGLIVEPDRAEELVPAMERLIRDQRLRDTLASAGRRTVEERFCFSNRMEKVVQVYAGLSPDIAQSIQQWQQFALGDGSRSRSRIPDLSRVGRC